jgi:hypothetical protein
VSIYPSTGRVYGDSDRTPVPFPTYRCKASASEHSPHNKQVLRKHLCKITIDHDGDHACICGKTWPHAKEEA